MPFLQVKQEYEVYDLGAIIGSVGGSLGLFVGFSFLQCLLSTVNSLANWKKDRNIMTNLTEVKSVRPGFN
jgi:hypothetical protein